MLHRTTTTKNLHKFIPERDSVTSQINLVPTSSRGAITSTWKPTHHTHRSHQASAARDPAAGLTLPVFGTEIEHGMAKVRGVSDGARREPLNCARLLCPWRE